MEQTHEIIDFGSSVSIKCFLHRLGFSGRHWHESMELLFVLSGSVDIIQEDRAFTLSAEDILLINSNELHELHAKDCVLIALQIHPSLFEAELPNFRELYFDCNSAVHKNSQSYDAIRVLISHMIKANTNKQDNYHIMNKALAYQLMFLLLSQFRSSNPETKTLRSQKNMERVTQIAEIIDNSYRSEITLASLASQVHLSVPYLSRFFDKQLGTSFLMYLNGVRLSHAVNDLLSTDYSIEQIAENNGFSSAHSFVQTFKKNYDCLPSVYRRNHQLQRREASSFSNARNFTSYIDLEQYDYMAILGKYLETSPSPVPDPGIRLQTTSSRSITITDNGSSSSKQPLLKHTWKTFLTVGSAKQLLYRKVQDMIRDMQNRIGYRYIKFHGILSDEMHVYHRTDKGTMYSFALVDEALDFLLSVHLKPLIQLSFMPAALAEDPQKTCFGYITSPPADLAEWLLLVSAFTRHLLERYGEKEVLSWPFCVWNEPDTDEKMFGFATDEEFYHFYQKTYQTVKQCHPDIVFGSPSNYYLTQYQSHWIADFLQWCRANGCMPEFLNMHFYNTTFSAKTLEELTSKTFQNVVTLSEDENLFHDFVRQIHAYAKRLSPPGQPLPVYLTEWNITPFHSDLLNDTCFVSCYIVKNILENYDELDSFAFWALTDFLEETPLSPGLFQGGLGITTYNGIPKAGYYAFQFLNQLGDEPVARGNGYFLTKKDRSYQLILYNYKHFSSLYAQGEMFDMTPANRYETFAPEEQLECRITIRDLKDSRYMVTESSICRHSGSSFDEWLRMGAPETLSADELSALKKLSVPSFRKYPADAENGRLQLSLSLEQLEVRLVLLTPQAPGTEPVPAI